MKKIVGEAARVEKSLRRDTGESVRPSVAAATRKFERGHYYEVVAEKDIYADKAKRQYEQALAMGAPYEQAVYAGQVAHEMAAAHFEEEEEVTSRDSGKG